LYHIAPAGTPPRTMDRNAKVKRRMSSYCRESVFSSPGDSQRLEGEKRTHGLTITLT